MAEKNSLSGVLAQNVRLPLRAEHRFDKGKFVGISWQITKR